MNPTGVRTLIGAAALVGCVTLALDLGTYLAEYHARGMAMRGAVLQFGSWFTVWANALCTASLVWLTVRPRSTTGLADRRVMLVGAACITLVGLVFSLLLRGLNNDTGIALLVIHLEHDIMPPLVVLIWLLRPHGGLEWRDLLWCLALPALYIVFAFARGALDDWYAYPFLDPRRVAPAELARNIAMVLAAAALIAAIFVGADRLLARRLAPR